MNKRVFISISIPEKAKKRLLKTIEKWQDLPVKWVREANLHITLVFLGFIDEAVIPEICEKVEKTCKKASIFDIEFNQIELFPSVDDPKLVALTGKTSEELKNLVNSIEGELGVSNVPKKSFRPHITLGRIRKHKWEALEDRPTIQEPFAFPVAVESVEIVSSELDEDKLNCTVLGSYPLQ